MKPHTQGALYVAHNDLSEGKEIFISVKNKDAIAIVFQKNNTVKDREEALANAERIVKACNSHDELVSVLTNIHKEITSQHVMNKQNNSGRNWEKELTEIGYALNKLLM